MTRGTRGAKPTTGQVASLTTTAVNYNVTYTYTYDANGNITSISDGTYTTTYTYDSQNQLIREDNQEAQKTWTWTYDNAGNILSKKRYDYTTGALGQVRGTVTYCYEDAWGDKLTSYSGQIIESDEIGNMLTGRGRTCTWEHGRICPHNGRYAAGRRTQTDLYRRNRVGGHRSGRHCRLCPLEEKGITHTKPPAVIQI